MRNDGLNIRDLANFGQSIGDMVVDQRIPVRGSVGQAGVMNSEVDLVASCHTGCRTASPCENGYHPDSRTAMGERTRGHSETGDERYDRRNRDCCSTDRHAHGFRGRGSMVGLRLQALEVRV